MKAILDVLPAATTELIREPQPHPQGSCRSGAPVGDPTQNEPNCLALSWVWPVDVA